MKPILRQLAAALALAALSACGSAEHNADATSAAPAGPRLRLQPVATTDWKDTGGEITTTERADARARIAGVLETLLVRKGDMVAKGQPIGRIVDNQLGFQAAAYGAQAAAAQAQLAQAQADLKRVDYLYQRGVYAKARLDQAQAAAGTAAPVPVPLVTTARISCSRLSRSRGFSTGRVAVVGCIATPRGLTGPMPVAMPA